VASHVSQASGWGALRYLYTLRGGEIIYTKDASGHTQQWQLTQMRVLEHTDFPQDYWSKTGSRQLVVTTCGGTIRGGHYDKNIFAIATPVNAPIAT
jgi:sorbitol-specific phosphotransferase system component IIBC